jgi:hypothetical protein
MEYFSRLGIARVQKDGTASRQGSQRRGKIRGKTPPQLKAEMDEEEEMSTD